MPPGKMQCGPLISYISMEDGSIDWRAMERTSQKAYQRLEKLLDWRENALRKMSSVKNWFSFLKVAVASSAKKTAKKVAALLSPLLSAKSSGATATATVKVAPLQ